MPGHAQVLCQGHQHFLCAHLLPCSLAGSDLGRERCDGILLLDVKERWLTLGWVVLQLPKHGAFGNARLLPRAHLGRAQLRVRLACADMWCTKHCHLGAIWSSPRRGSCGDPLHEAWEGPGGLLPGWRGTGEGHWVPLWLYPAKGRHVNMHVET